MSLLEMMAQTLGGTQANQISSQLGTSPDVTQKAIAAALPALLGGLAKNANASTAGAQSLAHALEQDHDGSVLDNVGGLLGMLGGGGSSGGGLGGLLGAASQMLGGSSINQRAANGEGILNHILGNQRPQVERGISEASGMDLSQVAKLLPMLAPLVMGFLGKTKRQQNLDAGGLAQMLGQEKAQMQEQVPGFGGLMNLLDTDGDGSVMDDLGKLGSALNDSGLLGGLFGK